MSIEELERTVAALPQEQLARFRDWFHRFENDRWDQQLEDDVADGRLDALTESALSDHQSGKSTKL